MGECLTDHEEEDRASCRAGLQCLLGRDEGEVVSEVLYSTVRSTVQYEVQRHEGVVVQGDGGVGGMVGWMELEGT